MPRDILDERPKHTVSNLLLIICTIVIGSTIGFLVEGCFGENSSSISQSVIDRGIKVSQEKLEDIASGLTVSGGGSLRDGWAVKSNDFVNLYFIAAEIDGAGMEGDGEIGLWASNSLEPYEGIRFSVNSLAKEFSVWPDGSTTDANITQFDDGADEAIQCVRASQED